MKTTSISIGVLLAITACSDDDASGETSAQTDTGTATAGEGTTTGASPATSTFGGTNEASDTASEGTTAEGTETGSPQDPGLELWPAAYQAFIAGVGGSKFVDVGDAQMHYVDTGPSDGETVLLIHGIPTHTYLWRNVIPELTDKRVIAVDLIGYGRSERPDGLPYTPAMQVEFLQNFAEALDLQDVNLVAHDLGGPVGLRWAFEDADRIQSITMFETLWTTLPSLDVLPGPFAELLVALRTPGVGEGLVGEQNVFMAGLIENMAPEDAEVYEYPWPDAADRIAVLLPSGPLNFPIPEEPAAFQFVAEYQQFLTDSGVPKLVLDITPGNLSNAVIEGPDGTGLRIADYAAAVFPNTTLGTIEGSGHYVQEDMPAELGQAINTFIDGQ